MKFMNLPYRNISLGLLYVVLFISITALYFASKERNIYSRALSKTENKLGESLRTKVSYYNSQAPYLNAHQNTRQITLRYCTSLPCMDSLENQFQKKLSDASLISYQERPFLYTYDFPQWDELKSLLRLLPITWWYHESVMGHTDLTFDKLVLIEGVLEGPFLAREDIDPVIQSNNFISINGGPFIRDLSQWFSVPYSDTLKITHFKDNFSYGMRRDSVLREYVFDVRHLKPEKEK